MGGEEADLFGVETVQRRTGPVTPSLGRKWEHPRRNQLRTQVKQQSGWGHWDGGVKPDANAPGENAYKTANTKLDTNMNVP